MNPNSSRLGLVALTATALLVGCTTASEGREVADKVAKTYAVAPGRSSIYVVHPDTLRNTPLWVALDGALRMRMGSCAYAVWTVEPGPHELYAYGENVSQLTLRTEADQSYFVRLNGWSGLWQPRILLEQVDVAAGKHDMAECRPAE